jgi:hypothetical protein
MSETMAKAHVRGPADVRVDVSPSKDFLETDAMVKPPR